MKLSEIKRPEQENISQEDLVVEMVMPQKIYEQGTGILADILIAPTLAITKKDKEGEVHVLPIDPKMFDEDAYKRFNNFTYSIGKMVRLAEMNLDTLIQVVGLYLELHRFAEIIKRNSDCKQLAQYDVISGFQKLSFVNLRNIFSCILKTDVELQAIEEFKNRESRDNFTAVYRNYIDDRDNYTHGILFFLYPDLSPVLRVKKDGGDKYIRYTKEVFVHNLMTFDYLTNGLNKIREFLQKKLPQQSKAT